VAAHRPGQGACRYLRAVGTNSGLYKLFLVLHFLTIIIGFGPIVLAGVFGTKATARPGREGAAISLATFEVLEEWAEKFIYAAPVFGILLVLVSDDAWKFSQTWISLAFLVYFLAVGVLHGAHKPNLRRMNALMAELQAGAPGAGATAGGPPPQVAELELRGRRAAIVGGVLNLLLVVLLVLMVWKPGA
jgi:hypothetical protein